MTDFREPETTMPPTLPEGEEVSPSSQEAAPPAQDEVSPQVQVEVSPPVEDEVSPPIQDEVSPPVEDEVSPPIQDEVPPPVEDEVSPPIRDEVPPPLEEQAPPPAEDEIPPQIQEELSSVVLPPAEEETAAEKAAAAELPPEQLAENLRRKEELCVQAEAQAESTEWKAAAGAIKSLQAEWKTIGPVPEELAQELWERFRKAGNHFFERRHAHFEERLRELEENKEKKEALCVQAEELADSTDWKVTAEGFKTLQGQWKAIGPVPRDQADAIWQRFRKANDEFFNRRQAHFDQVEKEHKENVRRKEELCAKAEELCESTEWKATGEAMKALQAEWKTVGPVPKAKSDALWKRFRGAMDRFFERRSAWYEERDQRKSEWKERLRETLTYKQEHLGRLRESITRDEENVSRWRERLENLRPGPQAEALRAELEGKVTDVTNRIETKRTRIQELETDVQEIEAKL